MKIPNTITVYHGTIIENLDSILEHGLNLEKNHIEEKLKIVANSTATKDCKQRAIERLLQAKERNTTISVSGSMEYARQNSCASLEWLNAIGTPREETHYDRKVVVFEFMTYWCHFKNICRNSYLLDRFEELTKQGWWDKPNIKKFIDKYYKGNPINNYHEFIIKGLSKKFLVSYDIWLRKHPEKGQLFDSYQFIEHVEVGGTKEPYFVCMECGFSTTDSYEGPKHENLYIHLKKNGAPDKRFSNPHEMIVENFPHSLIGIVCLTRKTDEKGEFLTFRKMGCSPFINRAREFIGTPKQEEKE